MLESVEEIDDDQDDLHLEIVVVRQSMIPYFDSPGSHVLFNHVMHRFIVCFRPPCQNMGLNGGRAPTFLNLTSELGRQGCDAWLPAKQGEREKTRRCLGGSNHKGNLERLLGDQDH